MKVYPVVIQNWEEAERGWGIRPDGYSLHKTVKDKEEFIREYWQDMPSILPDEYSRPATSSIQVIDVPEEIYLSIEGNGLRVFRGTNLYQKLREMLNH